MDAGRVTGCSESSEENLKKKKKKNSLTVYFLEFVCKVLFEDGGKYNGYHPPSAHCSNDPFGTQTLAF